MRERKSLDEQLADCRLRMPEAFGESQLILPERSIVSEGPIQLVDLDGQLTRAYEGGVNERSKPIEKEDLGNLPDLISEAGMEFFAVYRSFHQPDPALGWGIFFLAEPMERLAKQVRKALTISDSVATALAYDFVTTHELFHFRFDLWALQVEMTTGRPAYLPYTKQVYERIFGTQHCHEEALANRRVYTRAAYQTGRKKAPALWARWVQELLNNSPEGYRHYACNVEALETELASQLLIRLC